MVFSLLNIDAEPRFQGIASHEYNLIVSTNCLHATPFMANTMRNCHQLLHEGGLLVVNEAVGITAPRRLPSGLLTVGGCLARLEIRSASARCRRYSHGGNGRRSLTSAGLARAI